MPRSRSIGKQERLGLVSTARGLERPYKAEGGSSRKGSFRPDSREREKTELVIRPVQGTGALTEIAGQYLLTKGRKSMSGKKGESPSGRLSDGKKEKDKPLRNQGWDGAFLASRRKKKRKAYREKIQWKLPCRKYGGKRQTYAGLPSSLWRRGKRAPSEHRKAHNGQVLQLASASETEEKKKRAVSSISSEFERKKN